ncbi:MAG: multidrug ABC transporter permease [Bacteroides sp. SM23_62_1]|nr:MAG: multidrug ABC transporter permease [Bacteroides sp. SM23_62_1]
MNRFWGFVIKEINHILRDYRTLLILFGMPVIQLLLFGFVVTNELKDIRVAVWDQSHDRYTREIISKVFSSGYFILDSYLTSERDIEDKFREGNVKQIIIFGHDFAGKLEKENKAEVQLLADASDANTANLVVNYTYGIIIDYIRTLNRDLTAPMSIVPEVRMMFNENMAGAFMFVPGTMALILMLVSALMTSISIAREKELGTMETLLVSPLKPLQIVLGKVTPYLGLSFINAVGILVIGYFVFGLPVRGNIVLLLIECLLYIGVALSLGILISTIARTQQMAMFTSLLALMLPTILLSGFIFPVENMPAVLEWLSVIVPAKYFIIIIKNIMLKGTGIMFIWKETLVLVFMMAVMILISVKRFKIRLE